VVCASEGYTAGVEGAGVGGDLEGFCDESGVSCCVCEAPLQHFGLVGGGEEGVVGGAGFDVVLLSVGRGEGAVGCFYADVCVCLSEAREWGYHLDSKWTADHPSHSAARGKGNWVKIP